jgi:protein-tyrosine phosphatase
MIDLHSHILPGLDDGASDWEETVAMCRLAVADGIQTMAATPHYYPGVTNFDAEFLDAILQELRERLVHIEVDLELVSGAEVRLDYSLVELARAGQLPTLGKQKQYFLLELPPISPTRGLDQLVFQLQLSGLTPILSHPERTWPDSRDWAWLQRLVRSGCLVQLTANSITGQFGPSVKASAIHLLELGCCHLVASDAHSPTHRPPLLSEAKSNLKSLLGREETNYLFEDAPLAVLSGQQPKITKLNRKRGKSWFMGRN